MFKSRGSVLSFNILCVDIHTIKCSGIHETFKNDQNAGAGRHFFFLSKTLAGKELNLQEYVKQGSD